MNKIFRVVWNYAANTWVAVSELAKGRVKSSATKDRVLSNPTMISMNKRFSLGLISSSLILWTQSGYSVIVIEGSRADRTKSEITGIYDYNNNPGNKVPDKIVEEIIIGNHVTKLYPEKNNEGKEQVGGGISIGDYNEIGRFANIAIGGYSRAKGISSTAIGANALAAKDHAIAVARQSAALGYASIAMGASSLADADASIALGRLAHTKGRGAVAIGSARAGTIQTEANGEFSVALGAGAVVTHNNSVSLGSASVSSEVNKTLSEHYESKNDNGMAVNVNYAGLAKATAGTISVGKVGEERQIRNVAAGSVSADSTDAINGSQLYQVAKNVGFNIKNNDTATSRINTDGVLNVKNGSFTAATVTDGDNSAVIKVDVVTQEIEQKGGKAAVKGTTAGIATSADVVKALNSAGFVAKANNAGAGERINNGETISFNNGKNIEITQAGKDITVKTVDSPSFTKVTASDSFEVTDGPVISKTGIDAKNKKIINLADGTVSASSKDAVNGSQLHTVKEIANTANNTANNYGVLILFA